MKKIFIFFIRLYQVLLSPFLGKNCKFHPTCSSYAIEAIESNGVRRGLFMGFKRIMRCHPFSDGGYDPVEKDEA